MITIRKQQMKHFDDGAAEDFRRRLVGFIRAEMPDDAAGKSDEDLHELVMESQRRGAEYKVETERGIASFACLSLLFAQPADEVPQIKRGLTESRQPEDFLELLMDTLT
jgi:hypothetical protein